MTIVAPAMMLIGAAFWFGCVHSVYMGKKDRAIAFGTLAIILIVFGCYQQFEHDVNKIRELETQYACQPNAVLKWERDIAVCVSPAQKIGG